MRLSLTSLLDFFPFDRCIFFPVADPSIKSCQWLDKPLNLVRREKGMSLVPTIGVMQYRFLALLLHRVCIMAVKKKFEDLLTTQRDLFQK